MAKSVALAAMAAFAGLLIGCEGPRSVNQVTTAAGSSWNAVLPGYAVSERLADSGDPSWITTRNDTHLSTRSFDPILATTAWPQTDRLSLDRPRYIYSPRTPETFIFYRTESRTEYRRGR